MGSSENTLRAGSKAFVFFCRSPQWVRFFEWPGSGAGALRFCPRGEDRREAALMQVSFDTGLAGDWLCFANCCGLCGESGRNGWVLSVCRVGGRLGLNCKFAAAGLRERSSQMGLFGAPGRHVIGFVLRARFGWRVRLRLYAADFGKKERDTQYSRFKNYMCGR